MNNDPTAARAILDRELVVAPDAVYLARCLSIAARIEPQLVRSMRFACRRTADVGAESDLWFSMMVQARDHTGIVLRPDVRALLLDELRAPDRREELELAWRVLARAHQGASPVIRLEEQATYLAVCSRVTEMEKLIAGALEPLTSSSNAGMARWVARRLPTMPSEVRESEPALALARAASDRLQGIAVRGVLDAEGTAGWTTGLLRTLPQVKLSLRISVTHQVGDDRWAGVLTIAESAHEHDASALGFGLLDVPKTEPLVIDVLTPTDTGWEERRETLRSGATVSIAVSPGPLIRARNLIGDEIRLKPVLAGRRSVVMFQTKVQTSRSYHEIEAIAEDLDWESWASPKGPGPDATPVDALAEGKRLEDLLDTKPADVTKSIRAHFLHRDRARLEEWLEDAVKSAPQALPLLEWKKTCFLLWRPGRTDPPPRLVIGRLARDPQFAVVDQRSIPLAPIPTHPDLWGIAARDCGLVEGQTYHYWFEVEDTNPYVTTHGRTLVTDPTALTVDRRVSEGDEQPAAVILFQGGALVATNPDGGAVDFTIARSAPALPANNRIVIYALPYQRGFSFAHIKTLVAAGSPEGTSYLRDLGINALQLRLADGPNGIPAQNYFAPNAELGTPTDVVELIEACHRDGIRIIAEMWLAASHHSPYRHVNFDDFYVHSINPIDGSANPEVQNREGFGGDLLRYRFASNGYDPHSGSTGTIHPARQLMLVQASHWVRSFGIDGLRIDSMNNVGNRDFIGQLTNAVRSEWSQKGSGDHFLVTGEDWLKPGELLSYIDGLSNYGFRNRLRQVLFVQTDSPQPSFEQAVRELVDCRNVGFSDGSQAINFIGAGGAKDRIAAFLKKYGVPDLERRLKLAFVCLLTAVGVPLIAAGDEFGDTLDPPPTPGSPEAVGPMVQFQLLADPWRGRLRDYVAVLIRLRTEHDALSQNDTEFLHVDMHDKRVLVWRRGSPDDPVIVVANFSDWTNDLSKGGAEYRVPAWPTALGKTGWYEVTQGRVVPPEWVGREPIGAWEAKVYVRRPEAESSVVRAEPNKPEPDPPKTAAPVNRWLELIPHPPPLAEGKEWHVYLSYRSADRAWALDLYDALQVAGFRVFFDQFEIVVGDFVDHRLNDVLQTSQSGVIISSKRSRDSEWVRREYERMEALRHDSGTFRIVVAKLDDERLPLALEREPYVDFSGYSRSPYGLELLRLMYRLLGQPMPDMVLRTAHLIDEQTNTALGHIKAAASVNDPQRLLQIAVDGGEVWQTSPMLYCDAAEALLGLGDDDRALEVLALADNFERATRAVHLKARALIRKAQQAWRSASDDSETVAQRSSARVEPEQLLVEAQLHLAELYDLGHRDAETLGLYARTWMERYNLTGKRADLEKSRDLYAQGFELNPSDDYIGINAASKSALLGDLERARALANQVEVILGKETLSGDYWRTVRFAEALLLQGKFDGAVSVCYLAVARAPKNDTDSRDATHTEVALLLNAVHAPDDVQKRVLGAFDGHGGSSLGD